MWQKAQYPVREFRSRQFCVLSGLSWERFWVAGTSKWVEARSPVNGKESRSAEFFYGLFCGWENFGCKNAQRSAKAKLRITQRQQRYAKQ